MVWPTRLYPMWRETTTRSSRRQRQARRACVTSLAAAGLLYVASPYAALWSLGEALQRHDKAALCASLDWTLVRDSLKQSLGLSRGGIQQVSQQDELPDFGASFATGLASGMIDEDITPERMDSILSNPALNGRSRAGLPHGFFVSAAQFEARVPAAGPAPVEISMRIEKWRWKITRVRIPDPTPAPAVTHMASSGS